MYNQLAIKKRKSINIKTYLKQVEKVFLNAYKFDL